MKSSIDFEYCKLLEEIILFGYEKRDRTGTGTKSLFGWQIKHKMKDGFPLLTTKKMAWKQIVTELLWFLRGDTNIQFLHENNNHIWDGDYKKSGRDDGDLGPIYGHQWRNWGGWKEVKVGDERTQDGYLKYTTINHQGVDQIFELVKSLKENPDSRRMMVSAWNVDDLPKMTLPPCHYGFQVYTRELTESERFNWYGNKIGSHMHHDHIEQEMDEQGVPTRAISLMWNQRSVDTFLGLPFNIASYGLLLEILAKEVNMIPDELIGNLGDTHLYLNHIEQAKEQLSRTSFQLPKLKINNSKSDTILLDITKWSYDDFEIENYQSHPTIKAPLSN